MQVNFEKLLASAKENLKNAYAPYSKFKVGACAIFESGNIYNGCNVENSSYGLSLCAERNALSNAISAGEKTNLVAIAIVSESMTKCVPCGACRQWIWEFSKNAIIVLEDDNNMPITYKISELLPKAFDL